MDKISNTELSIQAYEKVKSMIMTKKIIPGQKIVQDKLAQTIGISRTPLRSALLILEREGLIESVSRKRVIVKEFSNKEIVEIYDCRIALEGTAIRLFTNQASDKDVRNLSKIFRPFLEGAINDSTYQKADAKFHDSIIRGCGNKSLYRIFK